MSLATVTVTVLPGSSAQASAAALTALVSASPEEAMSILRSPGPLGAPSVPSAAVPPPPRRRRRPRRRRATAPRRDVGAVAMRHGPCCAQSGWPPVCGAMLMGVPFAGHAIGSEVPAVSSGRRAGPCRRRRRPASGSSTRREAAVGDALQRLGQRGQAVHPGQLEPSKPTMPTSVPGPQPARQSAWRTPTASMSEAHTTAPPRPSSSSSRRAAGVRVVESSLAGDPPGPDVDAGRRQPAAQPARRSSPTTEPAGHPR